MQRRIHIPNLYAIGPPVVGPVAAIAWQEGHSALAGLLSVAFVVLVIGGAYTVKIYWK